MRTFYPILFIVCLIFSLTQCAKKQSNQSHKTQIDLRWIKSFPEDTQEKGLIGLKWILSYLGADFTSSQFENAITLKNQQVFSLELDHIGFSQKALQTIQQLIILFKETEEYKKTGSLDLGYFVMQCFNNSWHYYAITNVDKDFQSFKERYDFDEIDDYALKAGESGVTNGCRIFNIAEGESIEQLAFIAKEGTGKDVHEFKAEEFEVFDFMKNGQPRFAVYDLDGNLKSGADSKISRAGKPAKCMWCHESKIQPLHRGHTDIEEYGKLNSFKRLISKNNGLLRAQQLQGDSLFYWKNPREHSLAELLYKMYEEPTLSRLRQESKLWGIPLKYDRKHLAKNEEYHFLNLYIDSVIERKHTNLNFYPKLHRSRDTDEKVSSLLLDN